MTPNRDDAAPSCPTLLIAAGASGQGKTSVTAALARLHARQGRRVLVFKCGPDFLDPHWLALASGAPVHQIDLWMTGEADARARLHQAAREADLILVEGVMGLFDGQPSAADLALLLGLPVLAVIDASAMAGTFGAIADGLQHFRDGLRWAGVLANRVGSQGHAQMLRQSLREPKSWLGALARVEAMALPERQLGLVAAGEMDDALVRLDALADALAETPLGQLSPEAMQAWSVNYPAVATEPVPTLLAGRRVAVARDAAFCFIYPANLDCLQALGAQLQFFSPLADQPVPDCDAVWLPGGYPELHAQHLGQCQQTRTSLAAHVARGAAVWAECGGMMALFDTIVTTDGSRHAMWGLLPGTVTMQTRLAALGPQQLLLNPQSAPDQVLRGHTFHYSRCETRLLTPTRTSRPGTAPSPEQGEALYQQGALRASYFHAWFASAPRAVAQLFGAESA